MDEWLKEKLVCPQDHTRLTWSGNSVACERGHQYPVVHGVPVMLMEHDSIHPSHDRSLKYSANGYYGDKQSAADLADGQIDPFVQEILAATCGYLYKGLGRNIQRYPIPELRLPDGNGQVILDIGCNWGRWCIAAAMKGYHPVGVDPNLDALLAAQRVCKQLGVKSLFVAADARHLPFSNDSFDKVFSYSVIQHFSKDNARAALAEMARAAKPNKVCLVQMPNRFGVRSLYHQCRRRFRAVGFQVRYWTVPELRKTFSQILGETTVSVDGFFGLGIQSTDKDLLPFFHRMVVKSSELLRRISLRLPLLVYVADSVYLESRLHNDSVALPRGGP